MNSAVPQQRMKLSLRRWSTFTPPYHATHAAQYGLFLLRRLQEQLGGKRRRTYAKERMADVNRTPFAKWEEVYDEVNAFKHQPDGRAAGRTVTMTDAIESFEQMLNLLTDGKQKLAARYK